MSALEDYGWSTLDKRGKPGEVTDFPPVQEEGKRYIYTELIILRKNATGWDGDKSYVYEIDGCKGVAKTGPEGNEKMDFWRVTVTGNSIENMEEIIAYYQLMFGVRIDVNAGVPDSTKKQSKLFTLFNFARGKGGH